MPSFKDTRSTPGLSLKQAALIAGFTYLLNPVTFAEAYVMPRLITADPAQTVMNLTGHPHTVVLLRLEKAGAAPVSTLARAEGMRPQSMSAAVKGLLNAGLLKGSPDPSDARQTLMSLTPKCKLWLQNGRAARQDWLTFAIETELNAIPQAQLSMAIALLERLANR